MSISIHIHKTHREHTDGAETVEVRGGETIGACLNDMVARFPGMAGQLFTASGQLIKTIEIYHNMESAYPNELARTTQDGDEIHITVMLAGG
jgi:molybdopterin converting factor small subunit